MHHLATIALGLFALIGWGLFLQALKDVLIFRRDLALSEAECLPGEGPVRTPGTVIEVPPGTTFSTEGIEGVTSTFEDCRDAHDRERAKVLLTIGDGYSRLRGELLMTKVNLRRERRGLPSWACA